jgi:hypothetical protein
MVSVMVCNWTLNSILVIERTSGRFIFIITALRYFSLPADSARAHTISVSIMSLDEIRIRNVFSGTKKRPRFTQYTRIPHHSHALRATSCQTCTVRISGNPHSRNTNFLIPALCCGKFSTITCFARLSSPKSCQVLFAMVTTLYTL